MMNDNPSDILLTLQNLEALCNLFKRLHNSYASASLIVTIVTEAHTLSLKLQQMNMRWQEHMPFKEACDVEFDYWHQRILDLGNQFMNDEQSSDQAHQLRNGKKGLFLLDLYDLLPLGKDADGQLVYKEEPYFMADTLGQYLERAQKMQASLIGNYEECLRHVSHFVVSEGSVSGLDKDTPDVFWNMLEMYFTSRHCGQALYRLVDELDAIHQWVARRHERPELEKLADRVFLLYGKTLKERAKTDVTQWENTCPDEDLNSECQLQIDMAIEQLKDWEHSREFCRYVKPNVDLRLQKGTLGKFLFTFRKKLERQHVDHIIYSHYLIQFFKEYLEKNAGQEMMPMEEMGAADNQGDSAILLPVFFLQALREDEKLSRLFVSLLGTVEAKVNHNGSDAFKWSHVFEALKRLQFIPQNTRNIDFSRFIHSLFSNRTVAGVGRDLYRYDKETFDQTVSNVMKIFQPVYSSIFGEVNFDGSRS